jgi:hypothetical protein
LHKVVRENLATPYAATEAGFDGTPLPRFVRQELDGQDLWHAPFVVGEWVRLLVTVRHSD